jgi:hypothetical protein
MPRDGDIDIQACQFEDNVLMSAFTADGFKVEMQSTRNRDLLCCLWGSGRSGRFGGGIMMGRSRGRQFSAMD